MQGFPKLVTFLSCDQRFWNLSDFSSDTKVEIQGVVGQPHQGLGGVKPRVVQRCGHTSYTIRGVDGLSTSTLFLRGKMTPHPLRSAALAARLGPSAGRRHIGPVIHCVKKWSKKLPQLPSRVDSFFHQ